MSQSSYSLISVVRQRMLLPVSLWCCKTSFYSAWQASHHCGLSLPDQSAGETQLSFMLSLRPKTRQLFHSGPNVHPLPTSFLIPIVATDLCEGIKVRGISALTFSQMCSCCIDGDSWVGSGRWYQQGIPSTMEGETATFSTLTRVIKVIAFLQLTDLAVLLVGHLMFNLYLHYKLHILVSLPNRIQYLGTFQITRWGTLISTGSHCQS